MAVARSLTFTKGATMPKPRARVPTTFAVTRGGTRSRLIWLVGMVALPVITSRAGQIFRRPSRRRPRRLPLVVPPAPLFGAFPLTPFLSLALAVPTLAGEPPLPEAEPPEFIEPSFLDTLFDLIPPPPSLPTLPARNRARRAAVPRIAAQGCTGLGLASLVVAVVAPSLEEVPIERILPYLAPVTSACAFFPIPKVHTVCAADEPLIIDLGGLTKTPADTRPRHRSTHGDRGRHHRDVRRRLPADV